MVITWNPNDKDTKITLSNNNLTASCTAYGLVRSTDYKTSGRWYFEVRVTSFTNHLDIGVGNKLEALTGYAGATINSVGYASNGGIYWNGLKVNNLPTFSNNLIGIIVDIEDNYISFYKDGVRVHKFPVDLKSMGEIYAMVSGANSTGTRVSTVNFGASTFAYANSVINDVESLTSFDGSQILKTRNRLIIKNPTTNQHYSLAEKTLIPLPDASNKNMISFGIETGKEIKLDEDFDKVNYPVEGILKSTVMTMVKPLSIKFE